MEARNCGDRNLDEVQDIHPLMSDLYDDRTPPYFRGLVADLEGYDPRLFFRRNLAEGWWEIWRWRDCHMIPRRPYRLDDIERKAALQIIVADSDMDARVVRRLRIADLYTRFEDQTGDPEKLAKAMDKADAQAEAKRNQAMANDALDFVQDNSRQMVRDIRDVYSGYSPPEKE